MGLPFDWHLRPRRIMQLRFSAAQQAPEAGPPLGMGRLSHLSKHERNCNRLWGLRFLLPLCRMPGKDRSMGLSSMGNKTSYGVVQEEGNQARLRLWQTLQPAGRQYEKISERRQCQGWLSDLLSLVCNDLWLASLVAGDCRHLGPDLSSVW